MYIHTCSCLGSSVGLIFTLDIWFFRHFLCLKSLLKDISELTSLNCTRCMDKQKRACLLYSKKIYGVAKEQLEGMQKSSFFLRRNNSANTYMSEKLQNDLSREITSISCDRDEWYTTDLFEYVQGQNVLNLFWKPTSDTVLEMDCAWEKGPCLPFL